jgi:hypothetical protein
LGKVKTMELYGLSLSLSLQLSLSSMCAPLMKRKQLCLVLWKWALKELCQETEKSAENQNGEKE